jgi:S-formylglutathione hydrolase
MYKAASVFSPISALSKCDWGKKAVQFLESPEELKEWDASELLRKNGKGFKALVDQGTGDEFYTNGELKTEELEKAAKEAGAEVQVRYQEVCFLDRSVSTSADLW